MLDKIKKQMTANNVILIIGAIVALGWAWSTINVMTKNYNLERQVQEAELDNQIMELQNENFKLEQAYYQTNEYLELQARKLLNKAVVGEHMVILPQATSDTTGKNSKIKTIEKSNFEQWVDFLFGRSS